MFQERVRWEGLRDYLGLKGQNSRNTREAVSRDKHGQTVQYVLQF